jgi:hypothetical protein
MLSAQQVKSLLTAAVSDHLHKLNRVAALELADGIIAGDGRRSDLIMGWALRLKAARGPDATVDPSDHAAIVGSGLCSEDITEIDQTIILLRKRGNSETPRAKILQMLDGCGASQTPGDIVEAQSVVYRGQAAALMAADAERLIEENDKLNEWRPKTQAQVRSVAELFVKMIGADDASLVDQSRVAEYRPLLLKLPKNYGKDSKDFDRSLNELLEQAKDASAGQGRSPRVDPQ